MVCLIRDFFHTIVNYDILARGFNHREQKRFVLIEKQSIKYPNSIQYSK